jgi:hypothetical protein
MLSRILGESDPFGADHQTVVDTLNAVRQLRDDRAVPAVAALMRRKKLFARRKARIFKAAAVDALAAIGTPRADAALSDAGRSGDRLLKKVIRERRTTA